MNFLSSNWLASRSNVTVLLTLCLAYAILTLLAQIEFPTSNGSNFSWLELALWMAIFLGVIGTVNKLSASDPAGNQRRYWVLTTIAIVCISVLQSADWFVDTWKTARSQDMIYFDYFFNSAIAIIMAAAVFWSSPIQGKHAWVARSLGATVFLQLLSMVVDLAHAGNVLGQFENTRRLSISTEFVELLCIEFYIVCLALEGIGNAKQWPVTLQRGIATGGDFVGKNARLVYHDCNLFHGAKHPPVALAFYPVFREITLFGTILWLVFTTGSVIRQATGKSILSQFWEMTVLWFRDGIDPPSYYAQELYEKTKYIDAAHYLTRYETKNGLLHALNNRKASPFPKSEMRNKTLFARCCADYGFPYPHTLACVRNGDVEIYCLPEEFEVDLFCKRELGVGAIGSHTFRYEADGHYRDEDGKLLGLDGALEILKPGSVKHSMIVQPWLKNAASISDLARDSLITIRVVTCENENGEPEVTLAMLRLLTKLEPQWRGLPDEEYGTPIDLQSGILGRLTGDNLLTSHLRYDSHPVTGAQITGRKLDGWSAIRDLALNAHVAFPHRLLVGWDIALTDAGPVLLEGNTNLDVMFLQRVHDAPAGRSRLGELMNYHLQGIYTLSH